MATVSKKPGGNPLALRFDRSAGDLKNRLIWRSLGDFGTGKTHFALTAPGPIVFQSLDQGLEGVALDEYGKKDIYPIEYDWSPTQDDLSQDEAKELRDKFIDDYQYALKHARTIIWDKETDVWELFRYAKFGAPNDAPRNYPELNQQYRKYINMAKATTVNFGLLQGMKEKWMTIKKKKASGEVVESGAPSGELTAAGFKELEGLVHVNLTHVRRDGIYYLQVGKARGPASTSVSDQEFGPMEDSAYGMSFREFAQLCFPDTDESDWE